MKVFGPCPICKAKMGEPCVLIYFAPVGKSMGSLTHVERGEVTRFLAAVWEASRGPNE